MSFGPRADREQERRARCASSLGCRDAQGARRAVPSSQASRLAGPSLVWEPCIGTDVTLFRTRADWAGAACVPLADLRGALSVVRSQGGLGLASPSPGSSRAALARSW